MANTWHSYFDKTDVESWDAYQFHEYWICINKGNPEELEYRKAFDAFVKSLYAIINNSSDKNKIRKATNLLANTKVSVSNF